MTTDSSDNSLSSKLSPSFRELFTPKIITILKEGYDFAKFKADALAGLTVAIVALPLSMAIAIACGAKPEQGLYTAIVGGFIISALGGSRYQIGGPAGAFTVLIVTTIHRFGYDGFLLATLIAGFILMAIGFLRLGVYIKYIPLPVRVGFTAGIGIILFASQIHDLLGLSLTQEEPAAFLPKLKVLFQALPTINLSTLIITALTLAIILGMKKFLPKWPNFLIAVIVTALITKLLELPVETIGTRFGGVPSTLPIPSLPQITWEKISLVFPAAIAIALLGGIESLLSAVVADSMTGRRHRSNCELVAQGLANIVSALFTGLCATGTIARTTTNVRAGAIGPISGMLHSIFLLTFMLIAAPLASSIPLSVLAGILAVVSANMISFKELRHTLKRSRSESVVLFSTLLLTVFRDLTEGIAVGVVLGSLIFMHRMSNLVTIETGDDFHIDDIPDRPRSTTSVQEVQSDPDILVYRFQGPLFFGATTAVAMALERTGRIPSVVIFDFSNVPLVDSTGAETLQTFIEGIISEGGHVYAAGASSSVRKVLMKSNLPIPTNNYFLNLDTARDFSRQYLEQQRQIEE